MKALSGCLPTLMHAGTLWTSALQVHDSNLPHCRFCQQAALGQSKLQSSVLQLQKLSLCGLVQGRNDHTCTTEAAAPAKGRLGWAQPFYRWTERQAGQHYEQPQLAAGAA